MKKAGIKWAAEDRKESGAKQVSENRKESGAKQVLENRKESGAKQISEDMIYLASCALHNVAPEKERLEKIDWKEL